MTDSPQPRTGARDIGDISGQRTSRFSRFYFTQSSGDIATSYQQVFRTCGTIQKCLTSSGCRRAFTITSRGPTARRRRSNSTAISVTDGEFRSVSWLADCKKRKKRIPLWKYLCVNFSIKSERMISCVLQVAFARVSGGAGIMGRGRYCRHGGGRCTAVRVPVLPQRDRTR